MRLFQISTLSFLFCFFATAQDYPTVGSVERMSEALDLLIPKDSKIEVLAEGFDWSEGSVWVPAMEALLFTDVPQNKAYKWSEAEGLSVFLDPSGHTGVASSSQQQGANGLALDHDGNLILCQHGDRRVAKLSSWDFESKPVYETLVGLSRPKKSLQFIV